MGALSNEGLQGDDQVQCLQVGDVVVHSPLKGEPGTVVAQGRERAATLQAQVALDVELLRDAPQEVTTIPQSGVAVKPSHILVYFWANRMGESSSRPRGSGTRNGGQAGFKGPDS